MNKVSKEFSRFAQSYSKLNSIQKEVAKELVSKVNFKPKKILDLGSGEGEIYRNINWDFEEFIAVDISKSMCELHPRDKKLKVLNLSFDDEAIYKKHFDIIISSSALQWSQNLNLVLKNISNSTEKIAFSIFTSNTFKSLHDFANITSPIYTREYLLKKLNRYFKFNYEVKKYKLTFSNNYEMLKYIKNSGVSGGINKLNYKSIKKILNEYPLNYLEFEVIFIYNF